MQKAAQDNWIIVVVWVVIFAISAIVKKFQKGGPAKPFDEVDWEAEEFNKPQPQAPPPPAPGQRPPPRPSAIAPRAPAMDEHTATPATGGRRPMGSGARHMTGDKEPEPMVLPDPATMTLDQMREVVRQAAKRQEVRRRIEPHVVKEAKLAPVDSARIAGTSPPPRARLEAWDRPRVDLRDRRRLRDAIIAREVLERPRAFDT